MSRNKTFIIAEAGVNHNGSLELAEKLVDVAADCGADAIKFQTFKTESLVSRQAPKADYQIQNTDNVESQFEMIKKLELSETNHCILLDRCRQRNIEFLSTPFDNESLDFLTKTLELERIKLPSGEVTNAPLLLQAARSGRQIILSTGMCTLGDIEDALGVLAFGYLASDEAPSRTAFKRAYADAAGRRLLRDKISLLHCTTEYPAPYGDVNLKAMETMQRAFGLPVGFSDHTVGIAVPIAAVACGATIIEKHFTLDRNLPGPDHLASSEPDELRALVESVRQVEAALGCGAKTPVDSEYKNIAIARKSLVAACDIKRDEAFSETNLTAKRPGGGISPLETWDWVGRTATRDYAPDDQIEY